MCGIAGFFSSEGATPAMLEQMTEAMRHRGPDDEGFAVFYGNSAKPCRGKDTIDDLSSLPHVKKEKKKVKAGLGFRRLSILDLSQNGHQPMCDEAKRFWLVFNGEIYNFQELREELQRIGFSFKSTGDAEVLLKSYVHWGPDCLEKIKGMFSFAVFDRKEKTLFCARDRFGIKPFYYAWDGKTFLFSAEIKPILKTGRVHNRPCEPIVLDYLLYGMSEPHQTKTFFEDIFKLPPGHFALVHAGKLTIRPYWQLPQKMTSSFSPEKAKKLLFDAVESHLVADVPVGACLSGGLDSSAIVSIASKKFGKKFTTFSIVFKGTAVDESKYSELIVKDCRASPVFASPTARDLLADLSDLIRTQEEPFASTSIYAQYCLMRKAREKKIPVLLDGQGGDEVFLGYVYYIPVILNEIASKKPALWPVTLLEYSKNYGFAAVVASQAWLNLSFPQKRWLKLKKTKWLSKDFVRKNLKESNAAEFLEKNLQGVRTTSVLYNLQALLRYEDKNSMRFSIEARVPFLDTDLASAMWTAPLHFLTHEGLLKTGLREITRGVLHDNVRTRKDKIGFETPERQWFSTLAFRNFLKNIFNSSRFQSRPYWNASECHALLDDFLKTGKNADAIWRIVNVELWLREFVD